MERERIQMSQRKWDPLKTVHEGEQGNWTLGEAAQRLQLSHRQVRRLPVRVQAEGDPGVVHGLRGQPSNRKIASAQQQEHILARVLQRYGDFGPTLAAEHLAPEARRMSRESLREWMSAVGVWRPRPRRLQQVHVSRQWRAGVGDFVQWTAPSSPGWRNAALATCS